MTDILEQQPLGQLEPQDWMSAAATQAVMAALAADGAEPRFVGGCVRDAILRRAIQDIDIATSEPPEKVVELLTRASIRSIPTGLQHGTVTAISDGHSFEITTLRHDVETFGRHARVEFTDDWLADAQRRDFTINAMSCDPQGRIYDYFEGIQDLSAGRIRFVGLPQQRIEEDVLRLLRFFRFYAHYGRPPFHRESLQACRLLAPRLPELSAERVRDELLKLLTAKNPADVLLVMRGERILEHILPEAEHFGRLRALTFLEQRGVVAQGVGPDPIRRLACLLQADRDKALEISARLRLSNSQSDRLADLCHPPETVSPDLDAKARRRALHHLGADLARDIALLTWAERRALGAFAQGQETESWMDLLDDIAAWQPQALPVRGQDIVEMGVPKGPQVGKILSQVEEWWEEEDFRASRDEALAKARDILRAS